MLTLSRNYTYDVHSATNKPQASVKPGEVFIAETELCTGGWLLSPEDTWTPDKSCASNPAVCVAVDGAGPGDMLAVDILSVVPDRIGYTGFDGKKHELANQIKIHDWELNVKTVEIDSEYIHWSDDIKLPVRPMIGTLGTAPADEVLRNIRGGPHGGNMDVQEVCPGSTVYLPVAVDGALLHIGDAHALQGDGEINSAGGIECRATAQLRVRLLKQPENFRCVRIENDEYIMTVACERSLEESFYLASEQLLQWIADEYSHSIEEAFLLMGQVMEARCTQFVNPTRTYICKMPKKYL